MTTEEYKVKVAELAVELMKVGPIGGDLPWREGWMQGLPLRNSDYVYGAKELLAAAGIHEPAELATQRVGGG